MKGGMRSAAGLGKLAVKREPCLFKVRAHQPCMEQTLRIHSKLTCPSMQFHVVQDKVSWLLFMEVVLSVHYI
jgi:hypothetical protein